MLGDGDEVPARVLREETAKGRRPALREGRGPATPDLPRPTFASWAKGDFDMHAVVVRAGHPVVAQRQRAGRRRSSRRRGSWPASTSTRDGPHSSSGVATRPPGWRRLSASTRPRRTDLKSLRPGPGRRRSRTTPGPPPSVRDAAPAAATPGIVDQFLVLADESRAHRPNRRQPGRGG